MNLGPALCGVANGDLDADGLVNELEDISGWLADDPDSDGDGIRDGNEDSATAHTTRTRTTTSGFPGGFARASLYRLGAMLEPPDVVT